MGDEAFQTKKNEPTHISLSWTGCVLHNVLQFGPEFPAQSCERDVRWRWMRHLTLNAPSDAECANVSDRETLVGHITMKPQWLSGSADE